MSSKIEVNFHLYDGDNHTDIPRKFTVRHFRNYAKTPTGKTEVSQFGGYTVLADSSGELYIAKCNPAHDKFSRTEGLRQSIKHYIARNYIGYQFIDIRSIGINKFVVILDLSSYTGL